MKWLEGWLGVVAGGVGLVVTFLSAVFSPRTLNLTSVYAAYYSPSGGLPVSEQWIRLLIGLPLITATVLFAGVLWGVWLDLSGQRTRGRVILLTCATLLLLTPLLSTSLATTMMLLPAMPFAMLAVATGFLACLRRERRTPTTTA
jgi:hypothetical protein